MKRKRSHNVSVRLSDEEYERLVELKRQGTNLNQLTHRINEYSPVTQQEINNALQDCRACYQRVYSMTDKITDLISGD